MSSAQSPDALPISAVYQVSVARKMSPTLVFGDSAILPSFLPSLQSCNTIFLRAYLCKALLGIVRDTEAKVMHLALKLLEL